jgi:GIY-YIG catalytic domain
VRFRPAQGGDYWTGDDTEDAKASAKEPAVLPTTAAPSGPTRAAPPLTSSIAAADKTPPALAALADRLLSITDAVNGGVPDQPGLYAIHAAPEAWSILGLGGRSDDRPLYVGKAEASLVSRDLNTHFATGTTGRSSPRRSFAALLSATGTLELVAMPRRPHDPEPRKWGHFALEAPGDEQLTDWMYANLHIAVWPAPAGTVLRPVESAAMHHWLPPLNLTGLSTPRTAQVKNARARMAEQAKAWARERGFDV